MLIRIKSGVKKTIEPSIWFAIGVAFSEFCHHAAVKEFVITSMKDDVDGRKLGSLHETGLAVDIRAWHLDVQQRAVIAKGLHMRLDPLGFGVILHAIADPETLHFHIEYQPKAGEPADTFIA